MIEMFQAIGDALQIAKKDLLEFIRDRAMLISFVVMPIFMMVMMGYIFPSQSSLNNTPLGVVNLDKGAVAKGLAEAIGKLKVEDGSDPMFETKTYASAEAAKEGIKDGKINGAIVFPNDFSECIARGEQTKITLISDQSNPQVSSMMSGVFNQIVEGMSSATGQKKVEAMVGSFTPGKPAPANSTKIDAKAVVKPFVLETTGIVPGKPNYFEFMAPGIMGMIVIMAVMMGLAGSVSREKELGTLDGIMASPIRRASIILGKTVSQTLRGLTQGSLVLLLAVLLFGVKIYGSLALVALLLILGIFSFVGLGILVSSAASQQETAMTVLMTFTFPMFFLSGSFFPIQQMPPFMQAISRVLPTTYMIQALRKVIILGAGMSAIRTEMLVLLVFGIVTLSFAIPAFNRVTTR